MSLHPTLTREKWQSLPKPHQILNIAAELIRARNGRMRRDAAAVQNSLERAFELLECTGIDPRWGRGGTRELLRLREYLGHYYIGDWKESDDMNTVLRTLLQLNRESSSVNV